MLFGGEESATPLFLIRFNLLTLMWSSFPHIDHERSWHFCLYSVHLSTNISFTGIFFWKSCPACTLRLMDCSLHADQVRDFEIIASIVFSATGEARENMIWYLYVFAGQVFSFFWNHLSQFPRQQVLQFSQVNVRYQEFITWLFDGLAMRKSISSGGAHTISVATWNVAAVPGHGMVELVAGWSEVLWTIW